jgi:hypothetical protein
VTVVGGAIILSVEGVVTRTDNPDCPNVAATTLRARQLFRSGRLSLRSEQTSPEQEPGVHQARSRSRASVASAGTAGTASHPTLSFLNEKAIER